MSFLRRIFGRDVKTETAVQNGYTLVADDTKTSGLDWSDVLVRGGLGRDLVTGINGLAGNSYNIDTVFLPGEYYFDIDTLGDRPCSYGLLKVWRESSAVVYQIVQSSDNANNRMFSRCYRDGSWGTWTEYANASAIPPSQPPLAGLFPDTLQILHVGTHPFTIPANKVVKVLLIGGGGGGGGIDADNYSSSTSGSDGYETTIYPTATPLSFFLRANGGKGGEGPTTSNGSNVVYGAHGSSQEVEIANIYYTVILSYQHGLVPSNHNTTPQITHPIIKKLGLSAYGQGGLGGSSGLGRGGGGSGGAFVEGLIKNNLNTPLDLTIHVGGGGSGATGNDSNGQNGGHGVCIIFS